MDLDALERTLNRIDSRGKAFRERLEAPPKFRTNATGFLVGAVWCALLVMWFLTSRNEPVHKSIGAYTMIGIPLLVFFVNIFINVGYSMIRYFGYWFIGGSLFGWTATLMANCAFFIYFHQPLFS
jgi:hypothetical protein